MLLFYDFSSLADKSSGHTERREDGLGVREMGKNWGEKKEMMQKTVVKELGPFVSEQTDHVDQEQSMQFTDRDQGQFYLSEEEHLAMKHPVQTGREVRRLETKPELMCELKRVGFEIKGRYTMDEIKK